MAKQSKMAPIAAIDENIYVVPAVAQGNNTANNASAKVRPELTPTCAADRGVKLISESPSKKRDDGVRNGVSSRYKADFGGGHAKLNIYIPEGRV